MSRGAQHQRRAAGVDRKSIEQTQKHLALHWPLVRHKLETGAYSLAAVRAVAIPKSQGYVAAGKS